jgi:hypothetical protein
MIKKSTIIIALSALSLICTSAYAQGWKDNWRNSPLTSKTSNKWRNKPYTTKTSNSWRNSPLSARKSESKLRWNRSKWQASPSYWKNKPYVERPVVSDKWKNRWNKIKWRYSLINWQYSGLRYKNSMSTYESEPNVREVRVLIVSDEKSEEATVPEEAEEKKEYAKAQVETIAKEAKTDSKKTPDNLGHTDNYFTVISGKQTYRIEKHVQKTVHMAPGGLIEIYSSKAENP